MPTVDLCLPKSSLVIPQTFRKLPQLIPSRKTITHPTKREVMENHQRCQTTKRICDRSLEAHVSLVFCASNLNFFKSLDWARNGTCFFLISLCVAVQGKRLRLVAETYWGKGSGNFVLRTSRDFRGKPSQRNKWWWFHTPISQAGGSWPDLASFVSQGSIWNWNLAVFFLLGDLPTTWFSAKRRLRSWRLFTDPSQEGFWIFHFPERLEKSRLITFLLAPSAGNLLCTRQIAKCLSFQKLHQQL